ncbi:MAG TPA: ABC transporter substrate-binding protein [Mycobacteriales bacterium]|jgi:branched-chain amino acid transport system substrate-binding protein|nr:ABC transporter substrate-binding protein [Mycobacteriales bacterium]
MTPSQPKAPGRSPVRRRRLLAVAAGAALALTVSACGGGGRSTAGSSDAPPQGVTTTEIKIGGSFPFSGPFAAFANSSKAVGAYFQAVNAAGGVNGRKITYTAADDAYDPSRLAANARKSVEQDKVAAFMSFGGTNVAIQPYMNESKVPQIVLAGNTEFSQTTKFPYTHAWWPDLTWEAQYTTSYVLQRPADFPSPKIGLISLNNTLADSHIAGTVAALGPQAETVFPAANRLKVEASLADWTSQINQLRAAGVNVLYMNPGTAGQVNALKYIRQIGWPVQVFLYSASGTIKQVLSPVGLQASTGFYTPAWLKDPADPRWADDAGMKTYRETLAKYGEGADPDSAITANGYGSAQALVAALKAIGTGEVTPDAINSAWLSIKAAPTDVLMPGSTLTAGPGGRLVTSYQMLRFDGTSWKDVAPLADVSALGIAK